MNKMLKYYFSMVVVVFILPLTIDAKVSPVLENVTDNCDGTFTAAFGYNSTEESKKVIPIGGSNKFTGGASQDLGQPTEFEPGRHVNVFKVTWDGGSKLVWKLGSSTSTASAGAAANECGRKPVRPVLEKVIDNCDSTYTAYFGYKNDNDTDVEIPVGNENKFTGNKNRGQPATFKPGRHVSVFSVVFDGSNLVWSLDGRTSTASGSAAENKCGTKPVSPVLERVIDNCNDSYTSWFGYENPNSVKVTVPIGDENILAGQTNQPQPEVFETGRVTDAFSVTWDGADLVWSLTGKTATASGSAAENVCEKKAVSPVLEYVKNNCDNSFTAHYGYYNRNNFTVEIPVGKKNRFHGLDGSDGGQPTTFKPGRHRNVFTVVFTSSKIVWILDGRTSTAGADAAKNTCDYDPLSPVLERVIDNCDNTYTAWYGYENSNSFEVVIPVGKDNNIHGLETQPQVTKFKPGRVHDAFPVVFDGNKIVWNLTGHTAAASGDAAENICPCVAPEILEQPHSLDVPAGGKARFSVQAKGKTLRYRWKRNDQDIEGADDSVYTVDNVQGYMNNDEYRVKIVNFCNRSILSDIALLTVGGSLACSITKQPQSDTVEAGYSFIVSAGVQCDNSSFQWFKNGTPIAGINNNELVTDPVTLDDNGSVFHCIVSNGTVKDTSDTAILTVIPPRDGNRVVAISGNLHDGTEDVVGKNSRTTRDFTVKLYTRLRGSKEVYTEKFGGQRAVVVDSGRFTVQLGRGNADGNLQHIVAAHKTLYAELYAGKYGHEELLGPRLALSAAPYAMSSGVEVIRGEGDPDNSDNAPIGAMYVNIKNNNTWRRTLKGWVKLD